MERLIIFESFNFENLDRFWIKNVWDSSFTSIENIPNDYIIYLKTQDVIKLLNETCANVKKWISQQKNDTSEVSWQTLLSLNLDVQALLAILAYLIKQGQTFDANQDCRQSCLVATSLYFILLTIPGSNAFQAFHPGLYEIALKTLILSERLSPCELKTSKKSNLEFLNEDYVVEDQDFQTPRNLNKSQSIILTKGLNSVVFDLVTMLNSASIFLDIRSLETTVFHLVEMTKLANETMTDFSRATNNSEASINSLAYNAYVALGFLCNSKYGTISLITRIIGKYILPQLLISSTNKLSPKQMSIIRDSTIHFLKTLLEKHGRESQQALVTLIQHLMIKSPERLEGRQKQAVVVIKLINICQTNVNVYKQCLKDLLLLSVHNKISCRIFAQEIIGKYLLDLSGSHNRHQDENIWSSSDTNKLLLAAALSRCVDSSSMVRGRAIATFAEYTDSIENPEVRAIFRWENWQSEATEMPILEDLVGAIENNNVDEILPNFRGIIAMLKKRGEDERALVRKSAVQALRNGILVVPQLLDQVAPIITNHCRDAALTVRKFAIRVLTIILQKYPENSSVCKHWVNCVVPRVYDSETKVQDEVVNSLEELTVKNIAGTENFNKKTSNLLDLPWKIIRELARNKMGDHLAKACSIWVNRGTITSVNIANIKSHIGTDKNLEAWLILASLAENTAIGNMSNYQSYFDKALTNDNDENGFLSSIVVQVLRHSWPSFDDLSLQKIYNDLINYLKLYKIRETLISQCLDIVHGIGLFRSLKTCSNGQDGAEIMRELMTIAETTINQLVDADDGDEIDDQQQQHPGKFLLRATYTLGHASFLCTEKITLPTLRILQGFILEWNSFPSRIKSTKEQLQGAAITVLGQQALRDRKIAQEMTPIFGQLLRNTSQNSRNTNIANCAAVRINTAKVLADICKRFTALVEPYLPDMCISMKDPNPQVRQVILVIFIQLLADDFIRINGPFFFNILTMITDSDETIRQMTVFLINERLISKNKLIVTQQFINCIFHFNDYERRLIGNRKKKKREGNELEALTIAGEKGANERRIIYDFMLQHLDAPGKLTILVGLTRLILTSKCTNIRSGFGQQLNVINDKGISVFRDAIYIISSDYLQPNSCAKINTDEESLEDATPTTTQSSSSSSANSVIVEAMKKHRLNMFLPGLVELKERFAIAKSPLVADVAKLISNLLTDYNKDELENLYKEYPELEEEIERDIRKCDDENEEIPEDEILEDAFASSTPKKSKYDAALLVNNPDWMPRIVLRRISTLTYPEISELRDQSMPISHFESNNTKTRNRAQSPAKNFEGSSSPRVILCRLQQRTNPQLFDWRMDSGLSDSHFTDEQSIPRRSRD